MLETGNPAPNFSLPRQNGELISLDDLKGQKVVLYFYPKDNTPGCTTEGLEFSALKDGFAAKNTVVFGISKDSVKKHDNFCKKYEFSIELISDADGTMCEDYGVWQEKQMYGKTYMGIARTTFLLDEEGIVTKVWENVKAAGHAQEVLDTI